MTLINLLVGESPLSRQSLAHLIGSEQNPTHSSSPELPGSRLTQVTSRHTDRSFFHPPTR
ncbi:hypothetical protein E2C01_048434 [Portunus trituberculatus]|uniref:Uncharacterized protein n=1 Tax=Portunus trituberculatus TaxID=210409 RepID=A0A5B7GB48_PORTR|nr:hypothetical protein [Portunus trituberculatus]